MHSAVSSFVMHLICILCIWFDMHSHTLVHLQCIFRNAFTVHLTRCILCHYAAFVSFAFSDCFIPLHLYSCWIMCILVVLHSCAFARRRRILIHSKTIALLQVCIHCTFYTLFSFHVYFFSFQFFFFEFKKKTQNVYIKSIHF